MDTYLAPRQSLEHIPDIGCLLGMFCAGQSEKG